ncbi:hypothetical protein ACIBG8_07830 [Nonomuraea sp. NPDC050556]|uniref:hypothetical protein n=1 Tax=Nonomuraea sp. NPDC050556 TaxID=3364369 RepID=UPI0037ABD992
MIRAEWTKFRTVRGWVAAMAAAALLMIGLGLLAANGSSGSCDGAPGSVCPVVLTGPEGEQVNDRFEFVHRTLDGDGAITARVAELTGIITYPPPNHDQIVTGVVPWAKAGVMIKDGTRPGSRYAAVTLTGAHGVRMQHNFVHDTAGGEGAWLRLTRTGDTLTGHVSPDGKRWTPIGDADLTGLPRTVQIGLFVTSPCDLTLKQGDLGGTIGQCRFTQATATFDHVTPAGGWTATDVGFAGHLTDWERLHTPNGLITSGDTLTVSGTGDIGPSTEGQPIETTLSGLIAALLVVIVVAVLFITAEYRRNLIHTTLLAFPRRTGVLAAKAAVIAAVTFATGLIAAAVVVPVCSAILRANGIPLRPVSTLTELRVIAGAAAFMAVAAVFALAVGALLRRSAWGVIVAAVTIVLPYTLATTSILPVEAARWLLRLTPAAGLAAMQSIPAYEQVVSNYAPQLGYYPLPPWGGLAVLCAYAAGVLALATVRLRRRDA